MGSFDWKSVLGSVAPLLGTAVGGPFGAMAGKLLGQALVGDENASEKQIQQALATADPATILKVKEAELKFQATMKELDIKEVDLHLKDTQNARDMAIKTTLVPQMVLSAIFITGYFILVFILFSGQIKIDDSIRDMSNILIGVMTANIPSIMQFWFGSSHGSKTKSSSDMGIK